MRMFGTLLAGAMIVLPAAMFSSAGYAETQSASHKQMCQRVFARNQSRIEALAGNNDVAGIRSILASGHCSEFAVNISKPAETGEKRKITIHCEPTLDPPGINCTITFGRAIQIPNKAVRVPEGTEPVHNLPGTAAPH